MVRLGVAALTAAAAGLTASPVPSTTPDRAVPSPFGSGQSVRIAHAGRIQVDLAAARGAGLRRVACAGARLGTACYVAR